MFSKVLVLLLSMAATLLQGKDCALQIAGNDMMRFDKQVLQVDSACSRVTLTLTHSGQLPKAAMGHNWVLTKAADKDATVAAGVTAGPQHGYLQQGDARIIAATGMVGGKEQTSVTFSTSKLKVGEKYLFFCTFPGHVGLMTGNFLFTAASKAKPADKAKPANKAKPADKAKPANKAKPDEAKPANEAATKTMPSSATPSPQ